LWVQKQELPRGGSTVSHMAAQRARRLGFTRHKWHLNSSRGGGYRMLVQLFEVVPFCLVLQNQQVCLTPDSAELVIGGEADVAAW
jgi:hypothetical protein